MNPVVNNPDFSRFSTERFASAAQDRQITPREVRQLTRAVTQMHSLSPEDKQAVTALIQNLGSMTTRPNALFNPPREISAVDMAVLEVVAQDNPFTAQLLSQFQATGAQPSVENAVREGLQASELPPSQVEFPPSQPRSADAAAPVTMTQQQVDSLRPDWYLNQYNTGLPSRNGDCGPTSAAMVARSFGFQTQLNETDAVQLARNLSGGPRSQSPWAIGIDQLSQAVTEMTGNQITERSRESFRRGDAAQLMASMQASLDRGERPVLLSAQSQQGNQSSRHYMVILGPDPQKPGHFLIADPAIAFQDFGGDENSPLLRTAGNNTPGPNTPFVRSAGPEEFAAYLEETETTDNVGTFLMGYGPAAP